MDFVQQLLICILFIFHSMLNHSIEERRYNRYKGNYYFEVIQIGDLLLCV